MIQGDDFDAANLLCLAVERTEDEFIAFIDNELNSGPPASTGYLCAFLQHAVFLGFLTAIPRLVVDYGAPIIDWTVSIIATSALTTETAISIYQIYLDAGWNINMQLKYHGDVLWQAIDQDNRVLVEWLLDHGAQPSINDGFMHWAVLEHAVLRASPIIVSLLITQGRLDPSSCRALEFAARDGKLETVKALLELGAPIDRMVDHQNLNFVHNSSDQKKGFGAPLHRAAEKGHSDVVRVLLEHGANPSIRDSKGLTPSDWARMKLHIKAMCMLKAASKQQKANT